MENHYMSSRESIEAFYRQILHSNSEMTPEEARRTQKPYRYGMSLLCFGALINWVGLAENYTEPIRYVGVACIIGGALLICTAMCCWLNSPNQVTIGTVGNNDSIHVITVPDSQIHEKPPEYETVVIAPPTYDDAIKLNPATLLYSSMASNVVPSYEYAVSSSTQSNHPEQSSHCIIIDEIHTSENKSW